jgi:hypothetical protein
MARIAEVEQERLEAVPLVGLIEASGVTLTRQGADPHPRRREGDTRRPARRRA